MVSPIEGGKRYPEGLDDEAMTLKVARALSEAGVGKFNPIPGTTFIETSNTGAQIVTDTLQAVSELRSGLLREGLEPKVVGKIIDDGLWLTVQVTKAIGAILENQTMHRVNPNK